MSLAELRVSNLRCVEAATLELHPELNLIAGQNGAGKTSLLEAVFLLGRGRSFRTRNSDKLIRHGSPALTVFGRTHGDPVLAVGVEVTKTGTRARINGADAESLLFLSSVLPVQSIDPEIHKLIDQGPERRRRWLDWLVFHVEPNFGNHWSRYQRALKQRNAALKTNAIDWDLWDDQLLAHGLALTDARRRAVDSIRPYVEKLFDRFSNLEVSIGFHPGWGSDSSLEQALQEAREKDRDRGITTAGPHRADVILRQRGRSARETLSRGQQKLTAVAMIVAQLQLLQAQQRTRAVLLLDDPAAELDTRNLARLFEELAGLNCQMIATALSPETTLFQAPKAMFHVEQGRVNRL